MGVLHVGYALTRAQSLTGTPERPLSDLGRVSYGSYWTHKILSYLGERQTASIDEMRKDLGFEVEDIVITLKRLGLLSWRLNSDTQIDYYINHGALDAVAEQHVRESKNQWRVEFTPDGQMSANMQS